MVHHGQSGHINTKCPALEPMAAYGRLSSSSPLLPTPTPHPSRLTFMLEFRPQPSSRPERFVSIDSSARRWSILLAIALCQSIRPCSSLRIPPPLSPSPADLLAAGAWVSCLGLLCADCALFVTLAALRRDATQIHVPSALLVPSLPTCFQPLGWVPSYR